MKIISHRGNLNGPSPKTENKISTIEKCLSLGFDVEVDLWFESNNFFLGHDSPDVLVDKKIFKNDRIWFHLKNIQALEVIEEVKPKNYFWHEEDSCTITSSGKFWLYPGNFISTSRAIFVLPEKAEHSLDINNYKFHGICTDFPKNYVF